MSVGLILKQIRKSKNITQNEIAEVLHLSVSSIYRFERGGNFSYEDYIKYCKYLDVSPYVPIIICNNDKMLLLYNDICQTFNDKEMFDVMLSIFVQELNQGIAMQFETIFLKLGKKISDDFIEII